MIKKKCGILICMLLITTSIIPVFGGFNKSRILNDNLSEDIQSEKKTLHFSNITIKEINNYSHILLNGANDIFLKNNYYIVPSHIETFIFPFNVEIVDVTCKPYNIQSEKLIEKLSISPEPISIDSNTIDISYNNCNPIPISKWHSWDVGMGIYGNYHCNILKVQIFPIQYYPKFNFIDWAEQIEITIEYYDNKKIITFNDNYQFLVLTPDLFIDELNPLINFKNNRNISTKLVTLDEIYSGFYFPVEGRDEPEKIKYFIKNAIENWGTNYILLVGGYNKFPVRFSHVNFDFVGSEGFISDLYFADIYGENGIFSSWDSNNNNIFGEYNWNNNYDEVDLYPDIYLGRLACVNEEEVISCVNKIINYETEEAFLQEWFSKLIVIGGDTHPIIDDGADEGEYANEYVIDIMTGFIPTKCWASLGTLNKVIDISQVVNDGAGFIHYSGHGGGGSNWRTHPHENEDIWLPMGFFKNSDVLDLTNSNRLPIVIIMACSACNFKKMNDISGWIMVSNPNGGGIASCGASTTAIGYIGRHTINGLFEKICDNMFISFKRDHPLKFGNMWAYSINRYIWPDMDDGDYLTVEEFQPFGDPTLTISYNDPPNKPDNIIGPNEDFINKKLNYSARISDPDGDVCYGIFDWGDGTFSNWIEKNMGFIKTSHVWDETGNYQIKVMAKDIYGAKSEWSDPLVVTIPKYKTQYQNIFELLWQRVIYQFPFLSEIPNLYQ